MGQSRLNDNYSAGKLFFVNLTLYINQRQVLPVMVLLPGLTPGSRIQVLDQIRGQIEVSKEEGLAEKRRGTPTGDCRTSGKLQRIF